MSTTRRIQMSPHEKVQRQALRRRIQQFYRRFNKGAWQDCFAIIDPQLTQTGKVDPAAYAELIQVFKQAYRSVKPRWIDLSMHLDASPKQRDKRPFAYAYILWQDERHAFHMFRERWVQENGKWFTRVVGLLPNQQEADSRQAG
jgi:hypothetical protein